MEDKDFLNDFWKEVGAEGPSAFYSFETFIKGLLRHYANEEQKEFRVPITKTRKVSAVAPSGILGIDGHVIILIENYVRASFIKDLIESNIESLSTLPLKNKKRTLLIISANLVRRSINEAFEGKYNANGATLELIIWGPSKIEELILRNRPVSDDILKNIFLTRLKDAVENNKEDWKEDRSAIIDELKSTYLSGQFSLFLGAGVSSSAGMPDWNTLLNSLFISYLSKETSATNSWKSEDIKELVNRLKKFDDRSAIMSARYLRKGFLKNVSGDKEFREVITKSLYELRDGSRNIESELITSVASLCMPKRTGAKVQAVYTYNFDDLLERKLGTLGVSFKSIYSGVGKFIPDELPVYHVHGFLPENQNGHELLEQSTLVFSEEGYHQVYSDAYHWSNLAQLNGLQSNCCLMIGLSMSDPNLRRLLDISARNTERTNHFAFMKRLTADEFCHDYNEKNEKVKVPINLKTAGEFLIRHHVLNEELMKELGVNIIWYESYDEIPILLNTLK